MEENRSFPPFPRALSFAPLLFLVAVWGRQTTGPTFNFRRTRLARYTPARVLPPKRYPRLLTTTKHRLIARESGTRRCYDEVKLISNLIAARPIPRP